jgi:tRNA pseudouridine synthase 10
MTEEPKEEDDWTAYATAGFGQTDYSLWDDVEVAETEASQEEDGFDEGDDLDDEMWEEPEQLGTHTEEVPRAPNPAGHKHMVRIGCCDACLGRLGGKQRYDQSMVESGVEIRAAVVTRDPHLADAGERIGLCPFCEDLFNEVDLLADLITEALDGREIGRLQVGARFPKDQMEEEDVMRKRYGAGGSDPLKSSLVKFVSDAVKARMGDVRIVSENPEVLAIIDVTTLTVDLDVRSVYLYGRYRKLERGVPQTRWPCRACKGRGCDRCEGTGLQYATSVQQLVADPLRELLGAEDDAFHGMGREDIDVRCLGRGRPFVVELKAPMRRTVDAEAAMTAINTAADGSIEVTSLRPSSRKEVVRVKDTAAEKSYAIRFRLNPLSEKEHAKLTAPMDLTKEDVQERGGRKRRGRRKRRGDRGAPATKPLPEPEPEVPVIDEAALQAMKKAELVELAKAQDLPTSGTKSDLVDRLVNAAPPEAAPMPMATSEEIEEVVRGLRGAMLAQRTPERVAHRRADLVRRRKVIETTEPLVETMDDGQTEVEFTLRCESGTYVKETVHGDGGRTQPSVAALIRARCDVLWLDVADIHAD